MLNHLKKFLLLALGAGVAFSFALEGRAAQTNKFTAEIKQVIGSATVNGAAATKGMILSEGATLVTGTNSSVVFVIKEHKAVIRLQPRSTLSLDQMQMRSKELKDDLFDLKAGAFIASVGRIYHKGDGTKFDRFEIKTAKGVIWLGEPADFKVGADGTVQCQKGKTITMFIVLRHVGPMETVAGQTLHSWSHPRDYPKPQPTSPDLAAALDQEIKELKKLVGYR